MNTPKEAIKLARRLLTDGKTLSATRVLVEHNLMEAPKIGIALSRLEQEYGILDEAVTESEIDRHFRERAKSHELRDEMAAGEVLFLTGGIDPELAGIDIEGDVTDDLLYEIAWKESAILIGTIVSLGVVVVALIIWGINIVLNS